MRQGTSRTRGHAPPLAPCPARRRGSHAPARRAGRVVRGGGRGEDGPATTAAAADYLLQAGDSMPTPYVPPAPHPQQALPGQPPVAGPVYLISHDSVVPLGARSIRLPILMYHYIRTPPSTRTDPLGYRLSVSPMVFQSQMDWLSAHGYHAITFNQVRAYFAGTSALPAKPVVISVDDGHADLYTTAFPILQSHHFTAGADLLDGRLNLPGSVTERD